MSNNRSKDNLTYLQNVMEHTGYVCISDGRPRHTLPLVHAKKADLPFPVRGFQKPASGTWPVLLSAAQIWELLEGHIPGSASGDEKDKWFVYSEFSYHDTQPSLGKQAPNTVNGLAKVHICSAATGRKIFQLDVEVERIDVVALAHPNVLCEKFDYDAMIVGVVDIIWWESSEELVNDANETNAKKQVKGVCAGVLDVFLLVNGIEPIRLEDRSSLERFKDAGRHKLDMQMAMQRLLTNCLKMLTGSGSDAMATALKRGLAGRDSRRLL